MTATSIDTHSRQSRSITESARERLPLSSGIGDEVDRPLLVALLLGAAAVIAVGIVNATLVVKVRLTPLLATLATSVAVVGITRWVTDNRRITVDDGVINEIRDGSVLGVPIPALFMLGILLVLGDVQRGQKVPDLAMLWPAIHAAHGAKLAEEAEREAADKIVHEIPEELLGIGVRIEDDILITADGHRNLSSLVPTDPEKIEALCAEGSWLHRE